MALLCDCDCCEAMQDLAHEISSFPPGSGPGPSLKLKLRDAIAAPHVPILPAYFTAAKPLSG